MLAAELLDQLALFQFCEMSGWIIRMHQRNRARPWGNALTHRLQIQVPAMVVEKCIRNQSHVIERGQKIKEWITRLRNQNLVAGIAEQAKHIAVCLARAGGEENMRRVNFGTMFLIVVTYSLTRA